ncbi:MAG TPA: sulfurtransferase [Methylomirabilota bacterium]|nr:sulfurtransferase [Methylomirabilota bacterium]
MTTTLRDPDALISIDALAMSLTQPGLRIYDCTTYLEPPDPGSPDPYKVVSGRKTFVAGHIPGADFLNLEAELSRSDTPLKFMMPPPEQLARAFGRHGLGDGGRVVLYSLGSMMWATRVWWMLRALGFDGAAVLDGGFDRWQAEGRPTETGEPKGYPPATFTPRPRPGHFVDKTEVQAAIGDPRTVTVNALRPESHMGLGPSPYGRPGRVPRSVNVSAATLIDPETKRFVAPADALARFAAAGIDKDRRVIAYCGGGISATIDLFLLHQLGFDDLTLYDGSMGEWAKDPSLPIETG